MAADQGGPRETEGLEPDYAYGPSPRQLPTRPSSPQPQVEASDTKHGKLVVEPPSLAKYEIVNQQL